MPNKVAETIRELLRDAFTSGWCAGYDAKGVEQDWIDEEFIAWLAMFEDATPVAALATLVEEAPDYSNAWAFAVKLTAGMWPSLEEWREYMAALISARDEQTKRECADRWRSWMRINQGLKDGCYTDIAVTNVIMGKDEPAP